ncbi:histidine phosphatase family protein [Nocardia carnea]|uniref:histidine phosphatase family protein n=1 Tax=Nocardia carnea TaxID=37328 RepID=UPI0024543AFD|nr:histidine phosphatase family protein [Nocardia carnea]
MYTDERAAVPRRRSVVATAALSFLAVMMAACSSTSDAGSAGAEPPGRDRVVIFARHAESWSNVASENRSGVAIPDINPTDALGPVGDLPLTERGARQAEELAQQLSGVVTDVHASAQIRTFQTARAVAIDAGLPVDADWNLREISVPSGDSAAVMDYMKAILADERRDEKVGADGVPGESYNQTEERVQVFWDRFVSEYKGREGTSLIVTHGGIMMLHLSEYCSNREKLTPEFMFANQMTYTGQLEAVLSADGSLRCTRWGDKSLE